MRLAAILSPTPSWDAIRSGARLADELGIDAVGFWDHYHSGQPDWAYVCGWSALGAIAALTSRVKLLPMVLNNLHYEPGVLAKESSILSTLSDGRFELGIGAGDWPGSFSAWGRPFPAVDERLDRLVETIEAVRLAWTGHAVDYDGRYVRLRAAICTPAPTTPPRVVVGIGGSRRALHRVVALADEVNVYAEPELVAEARESVTASGRPISVSVFLSWEWDKWPANPSSELEAWESAGVDRACVSIAGPDMEHRIEALGRWQEAESHRAR
jgi:alkanesulfonate monooxygenase SsuD/methylene tetrahydromethanopterin reductase-like flavin-dependent oxidoreductase (luciferase family)